MAVSIPGVFGHSVFSGGATRATNQKAAAAGFAQIFTTMLAKQMRQSMVGEDAGPMGIGGGANGDIYGSMLDQALGKTLAKSSSMAGLTRMINRELTGARHPVASALKDSLVKVAARESLRPETGHLAHGLATSVEHRSQFGTSGAFRMDSRGPVLLPPAPAGVMAPLLQPPSPLEG
jgi:Rod binding domain-containing protein